jgi:alanyl-tRNA synthetase
LRFDFANPKGLSAEQLAAVEDEVNRLVMAGLPVASKNLPLAEARKLGAMMLFGEKYPDVVRVVSMGRSKELCGGTHLDNTGQIGLLKIVAEESVAAGVRRITALTGPAALEHVHRIESALAKTSSLLKTPPEEVPARVESLVKEVRELKKKATAAPKSGGPSVQQLLDEAAEVGGVRLVVAEVPEGTPQSLRDLIDQLRRKASPSAVLLASRQEGGKVLLVAGVSRDLVAKGIDAVKWVTVAARQVGGGGGGRPDLAQAGGKDATKLPEAFEAARKEIERVLAR